MKNFLLIFIFLFCIWAPLSFAEEINTGIIPGQIWYSSDNLVEGETVKIYTAIWNNNKANLTVNVEFYDKNVILGTREVVILPEQVKDVSISWKVTSGDHTIYAKIISSTLVSGTNKEKIILDRNTTNEDKKFVAVVVKNIDGVPATSAEVLQSEINKISDKISDVIPPSVSEPISDTVSGLDTFRINTSDKMDVLKKSAKNEVDLLSKDKTSIKNSKIEDSVKKPFAYIKLFLFSVLTFIFEKKIVFYGLIILITFFIPRTIYRKVRNK